MWCGWSKKFRRFSTCAALVCSALAIGFAVRAHEFQLDTPTQPSGISRWQHPRPGCNRQSQRRLRPWRRQLVQHEQTSCHGQDVCPAGGVHREAHQGSGGHRVYEPAWAEPGTQLRRQGPLHHQGHRLRRDQRFRPARRVLSMSIPACILAADDEAELAGVMAHEIGHVAACHAAREQTRAQLTSLASVPLIFWAAPGLCRVEAAHVALPGHS